MEAARDVVSISPATQTTVHAVDLTLLLRLASDGLGNVVGVRGRVRTSPSPDRPSFDGTQPRRRWPGAHRWRCKRGWLIAMHRSNITPPAPASRGESPSMDGDHGVVRPDVRSSHRRGRLRGKRHPPWGGRGGSCGEAPASSAPGYEDPTMRDLLVTSSRRARNDNPGDTSSADERWRRRTCLARFHRKRHRWRR